MRIGLPTAEGQQHSCALAEVLDGVLLTCNRPLSRAPGLSGRIVLVETESAR
ncbi:MAG: hypothetical protein ACT4P3_12410 [Betaproteobacteria bacterium]